MGHTAFRATLTGVGVDATNDEGIWSDRTGSLTLVVRKGSHAPGMDATVKFDVLRSPSLDATGRTEFRAMLVGAGVDATNDQGIWSEASGTLTLVARKGSLAPGVGAGVNFGMAAAASPHASRARSTADRRSAAITITNVISNSSDTVR